jgi:hypothetical protein
MELRDLRVVGGNIYLFANSELFEMVRPDMNGSSAQQHRRQAGEQELGFYGVLRNWVLTKGTRSTKRPS